MYPNRTYRFSFPAGLCKFIASVLVSVILPVVMNTLIGFNAVSQVHCDLTQVNHLKVFLLSFVKCISGVEEVFIYKYHH